MQSEIDVLTKEVAEVNELKAKVAEFDAMKEQFALIMANMQYHGSNIGSPFENESSLVDGLYVVHCIFELLSGLSNVKSLNITNDTLENLIHDTEDYLNLLPTFHNLTHLYVYNDSTATSKVLPNILRKTPKLEVLHVPTVVREYLDGFHHVMDGGFVNCHLPCLFYGYKGTFRSCLWCKGRFLENQTLLRKKKYIVHGKHKGCNVAVFTAKTGIAHGCSVKSLNITNETLECLLHHTEGYLNLLPTFHNLTHLYVCNYTDEFTDETDEFKTTCGVLPDILQKTPKLEVLHIPTVVHEYLDGLGACVVKFFPSDYEPPDDESDEDEAANSELFPAAGIEV
ncbi:hypothetical protein P8452_16607 [Trifolium repens]|nr:hypothetical protein P8452_16607 [Trifolium repens]